MQFKCPSGVKKKHLSYPFQLNNDGSKKPQGHSEAAQQTQLRISPDECGSNQPSRILLHFTLVTV